MLQAISSFGDASNQSIFRRKLKEVKMMERNFTLPEIILFAGTRIALGAGIGMLVSRGLNNDARKSTGWALTAVGAFTTIPFALAMIEKNKLPRELRSAA